MSAPVPNILRAFGIGLIIVGALFKIQHWPWVDGISIGAWGFSLSALVWRQSSGHPLVHKETARDLFAFGMVSVIVMRWLHIPGKGSALAVAVIGGAALLWSDRDLIFPGRGDKASKPVLFYTALILVTAGMLFRILHWPYGNVILLGGLAVVGFWFFASMYNGSAEQ
jgi:CBS-domain-containing membrane protein